MMGERTAMRGALFYAFDLERHVPSDHLIRSIDRSWTYPASASTFVPFTAIRAGHRSIRN